MASHTLAQNLTRLNKAREDIADAIVARGGSATHTDGLESMPTSIQAIPNLYTQEDNGKVVSNGSLVPQTSTTATTNGTIDTTTNNEVVIAVPNTYTQSDEGKVVDNGELVEQGSDEVTENGTVDTTLISSLLVNVSGGVGGTVAKLTSDTSGVTICDMYIFEPDNSNYIYMFGVIDTSSSTKITYNVPVSFPMDDIGSPVYGTSGNMGGSTVSKIDINNLTVNKTNRTITPYGKISSQSLIVIIFNKDVT